MTKRSPLPTTLAVLMNGRPVGQVERNGNRLTFTYDDNWLTAKNSFPLSLSMRPAGGSSFGHDAIYNWIAGLLPDNDQIIDRIAKLHDISGNNPYAVIWKIGQDCPGAVQFVEPERVDDVVQGGGIKWLTEADIADRLADLRRNGLGRRQSEGTFSLPGAQPKTALTLVDGRWGVPSGRVPTTHILKPPIADLDGHAENEVFCLALARQLGLRAAEADVMRFGDEIAIVVKRYDRVRVRQDFVRVHQEDMCQALSIHPVNKYERDGGPGIRAIMDVLNWSTEPATDRHRFMEALTLNFLVLGTDAHAKNYSVLFAPGQVRLAPLYDIASYLPYIADRFEDVRMPMRIDKYNTYAEIEARHWERMARACGYPPDDAVRHVVEMAERMPDAARTSAAGLRGKGIAHPVLDTLVEMIGERCAKVLRTW